MNAMNAKHTPGPWRVEVDKKGDLGVYADDYGLICYPVEDMYQENARLIAAAPEMADTLRFVLDAYSRVMLSQSYPEVLREELDDIHRQAGALLARIDGNGGVS